MIMLPALTFWADLVGLFGAGIYVSLDLGISMHAYLEEVKAVTSVDDVLHGLGKSVIFAALITMVGVVNGASVTAEVVKEFRDRKLHVVRFKRRKGFHRKIGHRQPYVRVKITDIKG